MVTSSGCGLVWLSFLKRKIICRPDQVCFLRVTNINFSPDNFNTLSRQKVIRIKKLISKGKMLWSLNKFSKLIFKDVYGDKSGEFVHVGFKS